ncbi:Fucoxanthin-chlorophyll a-c binding protein, partial [Durusdinium trenchii]
RWWFNRASGSPRARAVHIAMEVAFLAPVATNVAGPMTTPVHLSGPTSSPAGNTLGLSLAAAGGLAAVGLAARRARVARKAQEMATLPKHMQPVDPASYPNYKPGPSGVPMMPQVVGDWATPVPGSYKACLTMVGPDVETGSEVGKPWDPLGFSKLYDRNFDFNDNMTYPHVQWLREAELKHGRCAMLAIVGIFAQQSFHIDGYPEAPWYEALQKCYDNPQGIVGFGIAQISAFAMVIEGKYFPNDAWIGQMDREPGDLGFDPLKLAKDEATMKSMQLKELKNGRLAMMAFLSMFLGHFNAGSVPGVSALPRESAPAQGATFCGATPASSSEAGMSKTAARYTTQTILPSLAWIKTGVKASELQPTELKALTLAGNDVLIGKTEAGALFCVGNLCPHIGTPMSEGADVIGDVIVCPLHGSSFKVTTGQLIDWCVSPPIIGPLTGLIVDKKNLLIFECRQGGFLGSGEVEVLVDTNAKKAYEAGYWKGLLDAQGKDDGTYY